MWNNIPDDGKQNTHSLFKLKYKAYLINQKHWNTQNEVSTVDKNYLQELHNGFAEMTPFFFLIFFFCYFR